MTTVKNLRLVHSAPSASQSPRDGDDRTKTKKLFRVERTVFYWFSLPDMFVEADSAENASDIAEEDIGQNWDWNDLGRRSCDRDVAGVECDVKLVACELDS